MNVCAAGLVSGLPFGGSTDHLILTRLLCDKGLCEARYPSLPGLMKAKKKPVDVKNAAALGFTAADLSREAAPTWLAEFSPPPPRPPGRILKGEPADTAKDLVRILHEEEKMI